MTKLQVSCDLISKVYIAFLGIINSPSKHVLHKSANYHETPPKWQMVVAGGYPNACQLL